MKAVKSTTTACNVLMETVFLVSQGGEGLKSVEGSGSDGGQLVVVQRQQPDVVQPRETVVMDAADLVVPQHPKE